ncbi:hypothetical protein TNCV_284071 [Trichonephila clavipes]|uniref:Uncharacterized protein n=1 Tax=Trichonephila clavipes TaxID=2585209 RepID=A0A8X6VGX6_TRICX|nr:hypothetical protein TNCV_284071 [Trichonephila clavipes]
MCSENEKKGSLTHVLWELDISERWSRALKNRDVVEALVLVLFLVIEHAWDFLGRRLAARTLPPVTIRELRLALQDEWTAMPQQLIDTLILSMGRRCETCLARWSRALKNRDVVEALVLVLFLVIEHAWDFLGRRLAARTLPPVTIRELRLALQDEWTAMPQQLIDTLILSMGRRCETCLAVRGRSYPLLKTGCFLLDTHHRDVSDFSRIALHTTFSIKLLFIPLISLLRWSRALKNRDVVEALVLVLFLVIEHAWDFLGRRLAARTLPPVTIRELRLALQDEWTAMPQQLIDTLILSMGRRCETCLAVRGDHIPY